MKITNNLRAAYHAVKQYQPVTTNDLAKLFGYSPENMADYMRRLIRDGLAERRLVKGSYLYSVIPTDIEPAEFIFRDTEKLREQKVKRENEPKYPDGITIIGNRLIHKCPEKRPGAYRGTGQRPGANHGGFASSEMV
ncbi:MAG: hypothetical protein ACYC4K_06125 [Thiobacillus sp.]